MKGKAIKKVNKALPKTYQQGQYQDPVKFQRGQYCR